jgi:hypothetical protein
MDLTKSVRLSPSEQDILNDVRTALDAILRMKSHRFLADATALQQPGRDGRPPRPIGGHPRAQTGHLGPNPVPEAVVRQPFREPTELAGHNRGVSKLLILPHEFGTGPSHP